MSDEDKNDDTGDNETNDETTTQAWPENWRQDYAKEDESKLEKLGRYANPDAAFDALFAANQKISSGEYKQAIPFPEKGTDEEKASWRSTNGIPESAEKYDFGEIDEDLKASAAERAFNSNLNPTAAQTMVDFHNEQNAATKEAQDIADTAKGEETEDTLRVEWGNEFRTNMAKISGLLDSAPEGVKEALLNARLGNGNLFGDDADVAKFFAEIALIKNPTTSLVTDGGTIMDSVEDEIVSIKSKFGTKEYLDNPRMQERYRELIAARDGIPKT